MMKKLISENKWIIAASVFFIVWKFFLIGTMWHDRVSPPEPDDSYVYTEYIYSVKECPTLLCEYPSISFKKYTGFTYLSYRLFFGSISKMFNIDPMGLFYFSFYLGILILVPILIYFISCFTKDKRLIAFSLFFLALYNGGGSYHGFFWIVPSFFAVALFFLIFSVLLSKNKYWTISLLFLVPIFIFMHDISIYTTFIFLFYSVIIFLVNRKVDRILLKKLAFIVLLTLASYMFMRISLTHFGNLNPRGIQKTFLAAGENISNLQPNKIIFEKDGLSVFKKVFPAFEEFKNSYLLWIFPNFAGILLFSIILIFLVKYKQREIISLYFSALIFSLVSLLNIYGFRSLAILWPITFIFYAWGSWYILKFILGKKIAFPKTAKVALSAACLFLFAILNFLYSYELINHLNRRSNVSISSDFSSYLIETTDKEKSLFFDSKLVRSYALNTPLIKHSLSRSADDADYIISYQKSNEQSTKTASNDFSSAPSKTQCANKSVDSESWDKKSANFVLEKDFGEIKIYRNIR